jgi:hypothetical protein
MRDRLRRATLRMQPVPPRGECGVPPPLRSRGAPTTRPVTVAIRGPDHGLRAIIACSYLAGQAMSRRLISAAEAATKIAR